jgi:hypothetical protein
MIRFNRIGSWSSVQPSLSSMRADDPRLTSLCQSRAVKLLMASKDTVHASIGKVPLTSHSLRWQPKFVA